MNVLSFPYPVLVAVFLSSALTYTGCTESAVEPDEHEEPVGVIISVDGTELLRQIGDTTVKLGSLRVDSVSSLFEVSFIDDHGDSFTPESDEGFSLSVRIADTTVIGLADPIAPGSWRFRLRGRSVGTTTVRVAVDHGGHADFVSGAIGVEVVE